MGKISTPADNIDVSAAAGGVQKSSTSRYGKDFRGNLPGSSEDDPNTEGNQNQQVDPNAPAQTPEEGNQKPNEQAQSQSAGQSTETQPSEGDPNQQQQEDPLEAMRMNFERMAMNRLQGSPDVQTEQENTDQQQQQNIPQQQQQVTPEVPVNFVPDDFDTSSLTADGLNSLLKKVYTAARSDIVTRDDLKRTTQELQTNTTTTIASNQFFTDNPDLRPYKNVVVATWDNLVKANPSITWDQLFTTLEQSVRSTLQLPRNNKVVQQNNTAVPNPAFPRSTSAPRKGDEKVNPTVKKLRALSRNRLR